MEVFFHRLALQEYLKARRYYAARSERVAERFTEAVGRSLQRIAFAPEHGSPFDDIHRWVKIARFSYLLYYCQTDDGRQMVKAVAHQRRRLGYWRRRVEQ